MHKLLKIRQPAFPKEIPNYQSMYFIQLIRRAIQCLPFFFA